MLRMRKVGVFLIVLMIILSASIVFAVKINPIITPIINDSVIDEQVVEENVVSENIDGETAVIENYLEIPIEPTPLSIEEKKVLPIEPKPVQNIDIRKINITEKELRKSIKPIILVINTTWNLTPQYWGEQSAPLGTTVTVTNLIINNTGDVDLNFSITTNYDPDKVTYNISDCNNFQIPAHTFIVIGVDLTAQDVPSTNMVNISVTANESTASAQTQYSSGTFISTVVGPYMYPTIVVYNSTAVTGGSFNLSGKMRNLGTETAIVSWLVWDLPQGWAIISGNQTATFNDLDPFSSAWNNITVNVPVTETTGIKNITLIAYASNGGGSLQYAYVNITIIDITPPIITITTPLNNSYTGKNVWLNATTNEDATCSFGCQSGMSGWGASSTAPPATDHSVFFTNLSYGLITCSVTCNDTSNNTATSSVYWYVTKQYSFQVQPGWNFISVAYKQYNTSIPRVLESIDGKYDRIMYYDANDSANYWKQYATFWPENMNDLHNIDNTIGFWLNINSSTFVLYTVNGIDESSTQIPLKAGQNMVGYPSFTMRSVEDALQGLPWTTVEGFDQNAEYNTRVLAPTELMGPNNAYWINVTQDCTWNVTW